VAFLLFLAAPLIDDGDLEVEDDGPDEAQREFPIPLDDVFGTDVDEFDLEWEY
jgi:hypothetical protein